MKDIEIVLKLLKIVHEVMPLPEDHHYTHSFIINNGDLVLNICYKNAEGKNVSRSLRFEKIDTDDIDLNKDLLEKIKPFLLIDEKIRFKVMGI